MSVNSELGLIFPSPMDKVSVNDLSMVIALRDGAKWPCPGDFKNQPVLISLSVFFDTSKAANSDDLVHSVNYSSLCKSLMNRLPGSKYNSLEDLSRQTFALIFEDEPKVSELKVRVKLLKSPIHSKSVSYECTRRRDGIVIGRYGFRCEDIVCHTIIGVNKCERELTQTVVINILVERLGDVTDIFDFRGLITKLYRSVSETSFLTLEALTSFVTRETLVFCSHESDLVTVRVAKPDALVFAGSSEVEITRSRFDYPDLFTPNRSTLLRETANDGFSAVAIALGSNLGDSAANIELALTLLEHPRPAMDDPVNKDYVVTVVNTSFMYETSPMYVTDQPRFFNCACLIETNLTPRQLLTFLQKIEELIGRTPSIRNGPRAIDLDILFFDNLVLDSRPADRRYGLDDFDGELLIPHPRLTEREFVLRPLADLIPDFIHPQFTPNSIENLLEAISIGPPTMRKVVPFPMYPDVTRNTLSISHHGIEYTVPLTAQHWTFPVSIGTGSFNTRVMATLNVTPDSFSDGSLNNALPDALSYVNNSISAGADIIDIGGYSTRPGAAFVSIEEETSRVVPVIEAIRSSESAPHQSVKDVLISVDTFRPEVARAAILAGANCINDVYAFHGPDYPPNQRTEKCVDDMRHLAREMRAPVILMHSRGDAGQNKDYTFYEGHRLSPVISAVRTELGEKVNSIVKGKGGLRRWLVIVDPGVGFSKSVEDNLEILRNASLITGEDKNGSERQREGTAISGLSSARNPLAGFPQLIGASKKSFLGDILARGNSSRKTQAKERNWATAGAVACAVQQGAAIVRVHDVSEMVDVVRVASALWNGDSQRKRIRA